jgi:HAD superfamily hydrolase (TIGR01509 family)
MVKPDRAIFEYVLSRQGLQRQETLFIDDFPPNVEAARKLGIEGRYCEAPLIVGRL